MYVNLLINHSHLFLSLIYSFLSQYNKYNKYLIIIVLFFGLYVNITITQLLLGNKFWLYNYLRKNIILVY